MRVLVLAGAATIALAANVGAQMLTMTGTGEARVVPDRATIQIGVQSQAATASAAGVDNATRIKAVLDTLRALGIANEDLSTVGYNLWPQTTLVGTPPNQKQRVTSYAVTNTVRVDAHRLDDIGRIIDASLAKGANEVSSLDFYSSKADSVRAVALANAVTQAKLAAEAVAKAAGGTLAAILDISTESPSIRPLEMNTRMTAAMAPQTMVMPGVQTISATVTIKWAMFINR